MLEISQQQERNLRDELVQRSRAIAEQSHTITKLQGEIKSLRAQIDVQIEEDSTNELI